MPPHCAFTEPRCRRHITDEGLRVGQCLQHIAEPPDGALPIAPPKIDPDEFEVLHMMDRQGIDQLAQRLVSLVPPGLADAQKDLRANLHDVLAQGLRRLDLVTREEFDVQAQVLARTRAKLEALEQRLAALEAGVAKVGDTSSSD